MIGQKKTVPEDGSRWAVNPMSFKWGFIASTTTTRSSVSASFLSASRCPTSRSFPTSASNGRRNGPSDLKCLDGADAGIEVIFKPTTVGGIQAVAGVIEAVRDRLNGGMHDGKVSPIVLLEKSSYQHGQHGKRLDSVARRSSTGCRLSGPTTSPASPPPPPPPAAEQRLPSSRVAAASVNADAHLRARPTAAASPYFSKRTRCSTPAISIGSISKSLARST